MPLAICDWSSRRRVLLSTSAEMISRSSEVLLFVRRMYCHVIPSYGTMCPLERTARIDTDRAPTPETIREGPTTDAHHEGLAGLGQPRLAAPASQKDTPLQLHKRLVRAPVWWCYCVYKSRHAESSPVTRTTAQVSAPGVSRLAHQMTASQYNPEHPCHLDTF